jgi:hypothetical protein
MQLSRIHTSLPARGFSAMANFDKEKVKEYRSLEKIGLYLDPKGKEIKDMASWAMDALQPTVTTASIGTPLQFLQEWLPGFVYVVTAARNIDEFIGIDTVGSWEDEQVVQGIVELTNKARPYGDIQNVPEASWNTNFNYRTVVRFEQGMQVDRLDEARSARMRIDSSKEKRESCALALEIQRNAVGFFGYNNGANQTYGFLNDPSLPAYVNVPNGVSGSPLWSQKTYAEIQKDILTSISALRNQSQDVINPFRTKITLAVATAAVDRLSTTTDFGYSVMQWLKETYPLVRVVSAPELNAANGGANVFYLYADSIQDRSTDNGKTFMQNVPAKFYVLGVQQLAKGYIEDYSNATAGVLVKRPWAVVRYSGI